MLGEYPVRHGDAQIGTVSVTKQGLYYCIHSRCRLSGQVVFHLRGQWDNKSENLGVLVPEDGIFCLRTKIPVKRAGEGAPRFYIEPRHEKMPEAFIPIRADEPFAYLSRLENAYLKRDGDTIGIMLPEEKLSNPQGSDPSP